MTEENIEKGLTLDKPKKKVKKKRKPRPVYKCPKCDKIFQGEYKLNRHINRKYPCDKDSRQCKKCKKFFYDSSTRKRHESNNSCEGYNLEK